MMAFWQDLRYGARMLSRSRGVTVVTILVVALGIGATTACCWAGRRRGKKSSPCGPRWARGACVLRGSF